MKKIVLITVMVGAIIYVFCYRVFNASRADQVQQQVTIGGNVAPTINVLTIAAQPYGASINEVSPLAGVDTRLYLWGTAADLNGCHEVATEGVMTGKFYRTDLEGGEACAPNLNNCYNLDSADVVMDQCDSASDRGWRFQWMIPLSYAADNTTGGDHQSSNWTAMARIKDLFGATDTRSTTVEVNGTIAIDVTESIGYGYLSLGETSDAQRLAIQNIGNIPVELYLFANDDMICDNLRKINVEQVTYSSQESFEWDEGVPLTKNPRKLEESLDRQQDRVISARDLRLRLRLPERGEYEGLCVNYLQVRAGELEL